MNHRADIITGGVAHAPVLAALHQDAFLTPWSTQTFTDLLSQPTVRVWVWGTHEPAGFVLTQAAADEVEILTIAVRAETQRSGIAKALMASALADAAAHGAVTCHLEVAEDNTAAKALYIHLGFSPSGRRSGYYARSAGPVDAILMKKDLE